MNKEKPFGLSDFEQINGTWKLKRKKSSFICATVHCQRRCFEHRLCPTCVSREWRANNPVAYAYNNLKHHAKQRGIIFSITREQFQQFVSENNYMNGKGKGPQDLHIDRKNCHRGYELGNLQILTSSENAHKRHAEYSKQDRFPF
jgi:hypothetical protein